MFLHLSTLQGKFTPDSSHWLNIGFRKDNIDSSLAKISGPIIPCFPLRSQEYGNSPHVFCGLEVIIVCYGTYFSDVLQENGVWGH